MEVVHFTSVVMDGMGARQALASIL